MRLDALVFSLLALSNAAMSPPAFAQGGASTGTRLGTVTATSTGSQPRGGLLAGTPASVKVVIQGEALTSTNGVLAGAAVRLRDVRLGSIVENQLTDKAGIFGFRAVDPGAYIVEVIANDGSVAATSEILFAEAGQVLTTLVKLPFRAPPGPWLTRASAVTILSAAAAAGVLATAATGEPASPVVPLNPR